MALSGAFIAAIHIKEASIVAGLLAAYLVATGLTTMRPRSTPVDAALMVGGLVIAMVSLSWAGDALLNGGGSKDGKPAALFVVFGLVALVASASDLRLIRGKVVAGSRRLRRHLWRMCFALWIASASFFLGQADEIPAALRIYPLLVTLAFLPLAVMVYWLWRVRLRRPTRGAHRKWGTRAFENSPFTFR